MVPRQPGVAVQEPERKQMRRAIRHSLAIAGVLGVVVVVVLALVFVSFLISGGFPID
jgi:hypothetical protein